MKIVDVETFVVRADAPRPVTDSVNLAVTIGFAGVIIRTDDGLEGTGFSVTLGAGEWAIREILERDYAPLLIGEDPLRTQHLWERLYWAPTHWVGRTGVTQMALAAVDTALWDLKAKALGLPLWKLIGGHKDGRVRSYNTDGGWLNMPIDNVIEEMQRQLSEGWSAVKMKIGSPDPRADLKRVTAVREAIGNDVDLMLDVNQRWDTTTAITWARRFEELDIAWLEEPLDPDDVTGHARLAETTSIPIALGEHLYSRTAFRDYLDRGIIGYCQADVTRLGGVTEWLAVAEIAQAYHVPVVPHAGDLMRVHRHLGVGHSAVPMIECIYWLQDLFADPAPIVDGWFELDDTPGAGTTFAAEALKRYRVL